MNEERQYLPQGWLGGPHELRQVSSMLPGSYLVPNVESFSPIFLRKIENEEPMRTGVGASPDSRIIGKPWALRGYVIGGTQERQVAEALNPGGA